MKPLRLLTFIVIVLLCQLFCGTSRTVTLKEKKILKHSLELYGSNSWEDRVRAVEEAKKIDHPSRDNFYLEALNDSHHLVRIEVLKSVAGIDSKIIMRRIRYLAEHEEHSNVKWYALKVLVNYREAQSAPIFVKGLMSSDWLIREESIKGLLLIDDFAVKYVSIPHILKAMEDRSQNVRLTTLKYLKIKDERIYDTLVDMLDEKIYNKNTMITALLKALWGYRLGPYARSKLASLLTHSNVNVRLLALRVLKKDIELAETERER